jgi:pimeloyl-ACP methyl ester carboxylesterase
VGDGVQQSLNPHKIKRDGTKGYICATINVIRLQQGLGLVMTNFDHFYADVPTEQREHLRRFRAAHPAKHTTYDGHTWEYLTSGAPSAPPLLLLVGGLRMADAGFRAIEELAQDFYVIAPTYPTVATMSALCAGIAHILTVEGVDKVHVLGGSFGGMVAQVFAREQAARVARVILSTTIVPSAAVAADYQTQYELAAPAPEEVLREAGKQRMLYMIAPPDEQAAFWRAYLDELYSTRQSKADILSSYQCILDFMGRSFSADDLPNDRLLLLEADNDETFSEDQRASVRALYPHAQTHTFIGAGHSPATTQREAYFAVVRRFLTA